MDIFQQQHVQLPPDSRSSARFQGVLGVLFAVFPFIACTCPEFYLS
jgi:hypothetical protein